LGLREHLIVYSRKFTKFLEKMFKTYDTCFYLENKDISTEHQAKYVFICQNSGIISLVDNISEKLENLGYKVWIATPHPKTAYIYVSNELYSDLLVFLEKNGKMGITGVTNVKSKIKSRSIRYTLWALVATYFSILFMVNTGFSKTLLQIPQDVLKTLFPIVIFGVIPMSIFIDDLVNHRRYLKHSEKITSAIKETIEETCQQRLELKEKIPVKFPKISKSDIDMIKKHLGIPD